MARAYQDWISLEPGSRAQYDRLCLHILEVSNELTADVADGGKSRSTSNIQLYYNTLIAERDRLGKVLGIGVVVPVVRHISANVRGGGR